MQILLFMNFTHRRDRSSCIMQGRLSQADLGIEFNSGIDKAQNINFESFVFRDHVTFKGMSAKCLKYYHKHINKDNNLLQCCKSDNSSTQCPYNANTHRNNRNKKRQIDKSGFNRNLRKIYEYLQEVKLIKKYRNDELLKNAQKSKKMKIRTQRWSNPCSVQIRTSYNPPKNYKNQKIQLLKTLKVQIHDLNKYELRKYLNQEINYNDLNIDLMEIQKVLQTNCVSKISQKINTLNGPQLKKYKLNKNQTARCATSKQKRISGINQKKQNKIQQVVEQQQSEFEDFQRGLNNMIRARVRHQTCYNWQNYGSKFSKKNIYRKSIN